MADRLLVLVPHQHTHAPRSILEQARKLGPDVTEMRAVKHTMELSLPAACVSQTVHRLRWRGTAGLAKRPCPALQDTIVGVLES